jgi:hypothetical protein
MSKRYVFLVVFITLISGALVGWAANNQTNRAQAAPEIFASPIQAGCYIAGPGDCRIHADPFTIEVSSGQKLVKFDLVTVNITKAGIQNVIYDFRTDQSNPVPFTGTSYTPSLVGQDFAVTCGDTYQLVLEGQDSGDPSPLSLGSTNQFTCPTGIN